MHIENSIAEYLKKHKDNEEKIHSFSKFIGEFFEDMDPEYEEVHEAFKEELDNALCEITKEMIDAILENLKTKEGTKPGIKWDLEDVENVGKQYDVIGKLKNLSKDFDSLIFYFALNYVYIIHFNANRTINGYIDLAIDEYANKNICIKDVIKKLYKRI